MKANTAIAFTLSGLSLILPLTSRFPVFQNYIKILSAVCVLLIGVLTLNEYAWGWSNGIDQIFFREPPDAVATSSPGRMAPSTALNFFFIGLAMLVRKHWNVYLIHCVVAISLLGFLGYLYQVESFYGVALYTKMALHTSLTFLVLSVAVIFDQRNSGLSEMFLERTAGSVIVRRVLPIAVVSLILLGWLRLIGQRLGLYDIEFGVALFTFINVVIFTLLLWRIAVLLHRLDNERSRAEADRQNALDNLERRVRERTEELWATNAQLRNQVEERIRAEENIQKSEARYRTTLDSLQEGCQIIGFDYRYLYLNDVAAQQGRMPKEKLLGRTMMDVYPGIEQSPFFKHMGNCLEQRAPYRMENEFVYPDGSIGWFDLSIEPVPEGVFILSIDITKEKLQEKELQSYREHLEDLVAERTKQLENSNKELESFSYSVSHDLRAPLRHINGFVDLLLKHTAATLDEKGRRYLFTVASSAKEMGTLIDELLVFSRMARVEMQSTSVDMVQVVNELILRMDKEIEQRSITWTIGQLPTVEGDLSMLRLVFQNLIENAVKYTRPRAQAVIEIGSSTQENETVVFVRDNGVGFNMEYKDKLFGVFQRLHSAAEFEGTGIGLANVRRIIQRHGGTVWAESEIDNGATFYFSIPKRKG